MAGINAGVEIFEAELPYAVDSRVRADGDDRGNGSWGLGKRVDPGDQDGDGLFADVDWGQPSGGLAVHRRCWIVADASSSSESVLCEMESADGGLADSASDGRQSGRRHEEPWRWTWKKERQRWPV